MLRRGFAMHRFVTHIPLYVLSVKATLLLSSLLLLLVSIMHAQTIQTNTWVVVQPSYVGAPNGGYIFPQGWGNKGAYDPATHRVIISDRWVDSIRNSSIFANGIYAYDPVTNVFAVLKL